MAVTDAAGQLVLYVKQKVFKLKEEVTVFADEEQMRPLFNINADRVLDFSAQYSFTDGGGMPLGAVKREGVRSIWRAHYQILSQGMPEMTVQEENPWVNVFLEQAKTMKRKYFGIPVGDENTMLSSVRLGEATPEEAIDTYCLDAQALIDEFWKEPHR